MRAGFKTVRNTGNSIVAHEDDNIDTKHCYACQFVICDKIIEDNPLRNPSTNFLAIFKIPMICSVCLSTTAEIRP